MISCFDSDFSRNVVCGEMNEMNVFFFLFFFVSKSRPRNSSWQKTGQTMQIFCEGIWLAVHLQIPSPTPFLKGYWTNGTSYLAKYLLPFR